MLIDEWSTEIIPKENLAKFAATKIVIKEISVPINISNRDQHTPSNSSSVPINNGRVAPEPIESTFDLILAD
jgi:hypothetical protein